MAGRNLAAGQLALFGYKEEVSEQSFGRKRVDRKYQMILEKLDGLTIEVRRLAQAQEQKIVYLPRPVRPRATDQAAVEFLQAIFEREPRLKAAGAIRELQQKAKECGWRLGSMASLYRLVRRLF
jgi:hypothetical protein